MFNLAAVLVVIFLFCTITAKDPPKFNYSYYASFEETNVQKGVSFTVMGQQFYDPLNNRQRMDFSNGRYDRICGTILPDSNTPCQHIVTDQRRWIVFPDKLQCCFCCDAAHGCGILSPNWLEGADYLGQDRIQGTAYDKWSKTGSGYNYLWVTQDTSIPRKLDEGGKHIKNYKIEYFSKQIFPESVFALPAYCDLSKNCPLQSTCGVFRTTKPLR